MVFKRDRLEQFKKQKKEPAKKRHTIMLVDDEEPNLKILSVLLGGSYNIMTAMSAEEAMEMIEAMDNPEEKLSLVMCDQRMSGMTGVSFFEKINNKIPKTKRILVTGYLDMEALISSINEAHIYKFIMKPFNRADLMLSVKRAIEAYEMEKQLEDHVKNLEEKVRSRTRELEVKNRALEDANQALEAASLTDPLTGLKNRRFLLKHLETDIAMVRRKHRDARGERVKNGDLLFFLMDLDHFKAVNDTYGHAAGDQVLLQVRELLELVFRESDFLVRWGGEEFLVIARFVKRESGAFLAERIRQAVEAHPFRISEERTIRKTCSIGFAPFPFFLDKLDGLNWSQVVDVADACLYAAKYSGRNAWVGMQANAETSVDGFMQHILETPEMLIENQLVDLMSSLDDPPKIRWKKADH
ncbi:MAG: diguanylate cyclase [Acidobacteriota bacterium]|nr:diguanylate cyclase [Acidobacteriota bacterium]